ncbi:unnamed protein product [Bursaphelenchus xylophilus]|uniref:(pine wood nematode) hypothetical protein n=1 Tax=Bursaphelenchus xylophilus TaxID=6326 RepID=A0A1I7RMX7_BURXY|nr:unnamed protein product [Bursaphelenchus xylophilus]CAG9125362.1 unnamed protein product [Bursaphelenchus xylophilus]
MVEAHSPRFEEKTEICGSKVGEVRRRKGHVSPKEDRFPARSYKIYGQELFFGAFRVSHSFSSANIVQYLCKARAKPSGTVWLGPRCIVVPTPASPRRMPALVLDKVCP